MCCYNPMPHGKKISCRQFCKYLDGRLHIIIFSMVRYNKCEYLQHDAFPLEWQKKINCIMKKLNLFYYGLIQKVWMFATWCIPSRATRRFFFLKKKDISVIQKYSTAIMHTWGRLPLLPVFGTIFQKYTKLWQFLYLSGNL